MKPRSTSTTSLMLTPTEGCEPMVVCCGVRVERNIAKVQQLMTARGLQPAEQAHEWLRVAHSLPDPTWMNLCLAQAEQMADLVRREEALLASLGPSAQVAHTAHAAALPPQGLAARHFEWLGDLRDVPLEVLRDGIGALARMGCIGTDLEQQAALRRGLGAFANHTERTTRAPWVRWLADVDMLHYLVDSLWQQGLIHCPGGQRNKWTTLCGFVLHADGSPFGSTIRNSRCTSASKRRAIDEAILGGLRFMSRGAEKSEHSD